MRELFSLRLLILLLILSVVVGSCCKMACEGSSIIISLQNYRTFEIDTLYFIGYERNSNFSVKKDSLSSIITGVANDTSFANSVHTIYADKDWIIKVPKVKKEFRIFGYDMATARCSCGNKKYAIVKSFMLDGTRMTDAFLKLPR